MLSIPTLLRLGTISSISLLLTAHPALLGGPIHNEEPSLINSGYLTGATNGHATAKDETRAREVYGNLPLAFEVNLGQTNGKVRFLARGAGYSLFLTDGEAVLRLPKGQAGRVVSSSGATKSPSAQTEADQREQNLPNVLRMKLMGANKTPQVSGENKQESESNYFVGNDPTNWRTNVAHFGKVRYASVYPGIDQLYYGNQGQLEYDFVVAPKANYKQITMQFEGVKQVRIDEITGELVLQFREGSEIRQQQPYAYQEVDGQRHSVSATYEKRREGQIGFAIDDYDRTRPLVVDPVLIYSTYLGGSGSDTGNAIAVDSSGNAYVTGETESSNFPTANPLQPGSGGSFDIFVTKINAAGSARVYSTYFGGNGSDEGNGIAVDSFGDAYITGSTGSTNFPTVGPIQPANGGGRDGIVTKINAAGSGLFYSTYLGGSGNDIGNSIAVDSSGDAYITGSTNSTNFLTVNAIRPALGGRLDAFVVKINNTGSGRFYSTYLGGAGDDIGFGIAVDTSNNAYITGSSDSTNFPTTNAIQPALRGGVDAFVAEINGTDFGLIYATYLGGVGEDVGRGIAVDASGSAYVCGYTLSNNFPTANPIQPALGGSADAFVTKINAGGSGLAYSTYLGGNGGSDVGYAIGVDPSGNAYVTGATLSRNFPIVDAIQTSTGDFFNSDAFVTKINAAGSNLVYSTYLGGNHSDEGHGIAVDVPGNAFVTGLTFSTNFPLVNAIQPVNGGGNNIISSDAFVTRINDNSNPTPTPTPNTVQLSASSYSVGEGGGSAQVIVNRTNSSAAATVDYGTGDTAPLNECNFFNGSASSRCDYAITLGTLRFAAGEVTKTILIPVFNDSYAEGNETFSITLSNPTGMTLGAPATANISIQDNETTTGLNPIDGVDFFIRQNYIDFLGREPDPGGLAGWRNILNNCPPSGKDANGNFCDRIEVSAGFFRSEEFQSRGYFIYRFFSALGRIPLSHEFYPDFAKVSGFLTTDQLEAAKAAYVSEVMARPDFQTKYSSTFNNPTAYVDALLQTVGLPAHPSRGGWVSTLNASNTTQTRGQVLRQLVESAEVYNKYYNEAFVIMQYFGYLRRTADASYLNWIDTMNQTNGDYRTLINGFLNSSEYRRRFGP